MKNPPRISEAEWQVMKVFWSKPGATANDVIEALGTSSDWSPKTIRTLIGRLVKKNALVARGTGREYEYHPRVAESDCVQAETRSFLSRVYGGSLKPMLAGFLEGEDLSQEEIEDLKRILEERSKKSK